MTPPGTCPAAKKPQEARFGAFKGPACSHTCLIVDGWSKSPKIAASGASPAPHPSSTSTIARLTKAVYIRQSW